MRVPDEVAVKCPSCGETVLVELDATKPADQLRAIEIAGKLGLVKDGYDKELIAELFAATEGRVA